MVSALYIIALIAMIVLGLRKLAWAVFVTSAMLPIVQWLPPTGIPGLNAFNILVLAMYVGVVAHRHRADPSGTKRFPAFGPLVLFTLALLWGWINAAFIQDVPDVPARAFDPKDALQMIKSMWDPMLLMLLTYWSAKSVAELGRFMLLIVAGMSFEVGSGIVEWLRTSDRILGHIDQFNGMATFTGLAVTLAMILFMEIQRNIRWYYLAICIAGVFVCIHTGSRGGIIAVASSCLLVALFRNRAIFAFLLLMAVSFRLWMPASVLERFDQAYVLDSSGKIQASDTAEQRLEIWKSAARALKDHPLGVGLTAFPHYSAGYASRSGGDWSTSRADLSAHNEFVSLAVELGPLGLMAFMVLIGTMTRSAWICYRRGGESALKVVGSAALGSLLLMGISNLSGASLFYANVMGHFWMIMGLVSRGERLLDESRGEPAVGRAPATRSQQAGATG